MGKIEDRVKLQQKLDTAIAARNNIVMCMHLPRLLAREMLVRDISVVGVAPYQIHMYPMMYVDYYVDFIARCEEVLPVLKEYCEKRILEISEELNKE